MTHNLLYGDMSHVESDLALTHIWCFDDMSHVESDLALTHIWCFDDMSHVESDLAMTHFRILEFWVMEQQNLNIYYSFVHHGSQAELLL